MKSEPERGLALAIRQYGGLVKRVIITILPTADSRDVEECIADVFFKFYQSIGRFDAASGSLKNYLCGIARHVALDKARKTGRLGLQPLTGAELGLTADISEAVSRREQAELVQETVLALPPPDKEIFVLRYYFGQKISEIAAKLQLNEKAVENRLFRGRKKLKDALQKRGVSL